MPNPENIVNHKFKKGQSGNPNGKPRKIISQLKAVGYTKAEASDTINTMLAMTLDEIRDVFNNKQATVLEKTIAAALKRSLERGSLYTIDSLLDRTHGKAIEKIQAEHDGNVKIIVEYVDKQITTE